MRFRVFAGAALGAAMVVAMPATGKAPRKVKPVADCPADPALPPDLADWGRMSSAKTIYAYGEARAADWPSLGAARTGLLLHKAESLRYWIAPERRQDVFKFGGMIPVEVKRAGRLVIALDAGAWIDLVRDGKAQPAAAHGHGPACSGIRKTVEYDVTPGRYLVQIVNAPELSIRAMAVLRD